MAMAHRLRAQGSAAAITVIEARQALTGTSPKARAALLKAAAGLGVTVLEGVSASAVTAEGVRLDDGRRVAARFVVGAAGARPQGWLATTGLDLTDGFVTVDPMLRSVTDPAIYAVGDCAHIAHAPRPKAGVYAVRAAPVLGHNLRADLSGGARRRFVPQGDYLKLISLGRRAALADKWGVTLQGDWVWAWKDRIDRRFMDRLADLPAMPLPAVPREVAQDVRTAMSDPQALCGGCGAKIGAGPLSRVLGRLPPQAAPGLLTGAGDDAAVLQTGGVRQVLTTDHLRAFTEDPHLMARIAALHALGDIWAMGATPQVALASIILPRMSERMSEAWLDEIMGAAAGIFAAEGAAIAGGHTTQGAELTIGFTVTGLLDRPAITVAGARPGDALILTRPIGSGVLLAAEMAGRARGADIAALWQTMTRSQADAAAILRDAHAMTDVTGFGLAGHLMATCRASGCAAEVRLADVPIFEGAAGLAQAGVRSTLFAQNLMALGSGLDGPATAEADLMVDPQTAGGLLAAVDPGGADEVLAALRDAGHAAARIGEIAAGAPRVTLR
jgi:selenide,water dikinase